MVVRVGTKKRVFNIDEYRKTDIVLSADSPVEGGKHGVDIQDGDDEDVDDDDNDDDDDDDAAREKRELSPSAKTAHAEEDIPQSRFRSNVVLDRCIAPSHKQQRCSNSERASRISEVASVLAAAVSAVERKSLQSSFSSVGIRDSKFSKDSTESKASKKTSRLSQDQLTGEHANSIVR